MQRYLRIIDGISEWTGRISSFFLVAAALAVAVEVTMRYVFNAPPQWGFELSTYLCIVAYLMGGAYAELYKDHVRIDILYNRYSPRVRALVDILISAPVFFLGISIVLWYGVQETIKDFENGSTSGTPWGPIIWPVRAVIALGALTLIFEGLNTLIRNIAIARTGVETAVKTQEVL